MTKTSIVLLQEFVCDKILNNCSQIQRHFLQHKESFKTQIFRNSCRNEVSFTLLSFLYAYVIISVSLELTLYFTPESIQNFVWTLLITGGLLWITVSYSLLTLGNVAFWGEKKLFCAQTFFCDQIPVCSPLFGLCRFFPYNFFVNLFLPLFVNLSLYPLCLQSAAVSLVSHHWLRNY